MKKPIYFTLCFFCFLLLSSCSSYKGIPYFQNLDKSRVSKENIENFTAVTIQTEDILGISVSSLNAEASSVFNANLTSTEGSYSVNSNNHSLGYLVDQKGEIQLPLIGDLKVVGLTTSQLREQVRLKLLTYLKEPVVNVRILNFKVSVMGDVGRPGVYQVQNERLTIPEAITLAGDLNITANRNDLWLVREKDGKREYIPLDLTSKNLFTSPYYFLKNNDLIYVQPGRAKFASVDNNYRNISLVLSALSIVAILLTR
jgi:polysaccharide biosynthesis/export protein